MHMANLENILIWKKASGYPQNKREHWTHVAHWCENRIESFRPLKKTTRQNDLMKIRYHTGHAIEIRQRNVIYLTFKHIEIHYIGFRSRTR